MKQKTLDILDKDLSTTHSYYLGLKREVRFRFLREEFLMDKTYWDTYYPLLDKHVYNWKEFKYTDIKLPDSLDRLITTDAIGIYLFIIRSENLFLDMPKYVFYVGISGGNSSRRPLRERLKDYFRLEEIKKRKKVHRMLSMYYSNVYVMYSPMVIDFADLKKLEVDLHGYFYPICSERDFPIEIKKLRQSDLR